MKHLLTKTNGSSVYKTQGAAKQAANRFLKANQGDYRMDMQQVDNGFEVTMVELVEATNQPQDEIKALKDKIAELEAANRKGNEALAALKRIDDTYNRLYLPSFSTDFVFGLGEFKDNGIDIETYEEMYLGNELAYGLASEIVNNTDPLKALNELVDCGQAVIQKDDDGYISLKGVNSEYSFSELEYGIDSDDLFTEKMKLFAETYPEKVTEVSDVKYSGGHGTTLASLYPTQPVKLPEGEEWC